MISGPTLDAGQQRVDFSYLTCSSGQKRISRPPAITHRRRRLWRRNRLPPLPFLLHNLALLDLLDACRGPSLRHRSFSATLNRSMRTSCRLCGSRILHEGPPRALISPHSARLSTMLSVTQLAAQALFLVFCRPLLPCSPIQVISRSSHSNFARFQPDSSLASPTRASLLRRRRNQFSLSILTQEVPLN